METLMERYCGAQGFISPGGGGDVSFTGINLALTTGQTYAAVVDFQGYSGKSSTLLLLMLTREQHVVV